MKSIFLSLILLASSVQAANIHSAKYDAKNDQIELDLTYGGCGLETFKLSFGACMETFPMQVRATLDDSRDICRAIIRTKLRFALGELAGCRPAQVSIKTKHSNPPVSVFVPAKGTSASQTLELPFTMDAASVQAVLKEVLYSKLEKDGPSTEEFQAKLTGNYGHVILEDKNAKLECSEQSAGMLAVQTFGCKITKKTDGPAFPNYLELPFTMDSASVQAVLKGLLFAKLESEGPQTQPSQAKLTGSYRQVVLEDEKSSVTCREGQLGMAAVQQFQCVFAVK